MAKAGFDPRESVKLWINMGRADSGQPPEFLSTHPSHSTRISDLNAHMPVALNLQSVPGNRASARSAADGKVL
jgi:predicted Zn-dependent protease